MQLRVSCKPPLSAISTISRCRPWGATTNEPELSGKSGTASRLSENDAWENSRGWHRHSSAAGAAIEQTEPDECRCAQHKRLSGLGSEGPHVAKATPTIVRTRPLTGNALSERLSVPPASLPTAAPIMGVFSLESPRLCQPPHLPSPLLSTIYAQNRPIVKSG